MSDYCLDLNEDQLTMQKWVHDFAENVMRPVAAEYDEKEETPWEVIQEAANIGLYSWEAVSSWFSDPTGLTFPMVSEELSLGLRRHRARDHGHRRSACRASSATARPSRSPNGSPSASAPPTTSTSPPSRSPSPTPAPTSRTCAPRGLRRGDGRVGDQRHQDVDHQRWHHKVPNVHVVVASVEPELKGRGQASFVVPPGTPGLSQGQKFKKMGIRASHTAEVVLEDVRVPGRCLLGGKEKLDARIARPEGQSSRVQAAMSTFEASRPLVGAQALGIARAAYEYSLDYAKERRRSAGRSSRTRASPSSSPT